MSQTAGPTAALAGIPAGLQSQGVWAGRRQLFVRFAAEAETATMYTADALANVGHETGRYHADDEGDTARHWSAAFSDSSSLPRLRSAAALRWSALAL